MAPLSSEDMLFCVMRKLIAHPAPVLPLHSYAGLVACRLFLGISEAAVTPGFVSLLSVRASRVLLSDRSFATIQILITGRFYTRKEQLSRTAIWFSVSRTIDSVLFR